MTVPSTAKTITLKIEKSATLTFEEWCDITTDVDSDDFNDRESFLAVCRVKWEELLKAAYDPTTCTYELIKDDEDLTEEDINDIIDTFV